MKLFWIAPSSWIQTSSDPYFPKGLLLLNLKRQAEAEQAIRAGLGSIPDSCRWILSSRPGLLEAGKAEEAMASFERAIAVNASLRASLFALASIYESRHDRDRAIAVLKNICRASTHEIGISGISSFGSMWQAKDYQGAKKELEDLLADDPSDLDAHLRMALIHGEQKEYPLGHRSA